MGRNQRVELAKAFADFQEIQSPPDSHNDELSILHAELEDYAGYSAGIITQLLDGAKHTAQPLGIDADLRTRIEKFAGSHSGVARDTALVYLRYLARLEALIVLAGGLDEGAR